MSTLGRRSPIETRAFVFDLVCQAAVTGQRCHATANEIAEAT